MISTNKIKSNPSISHKNYYHSVGYWNATPEIKQVEFQNGKIILKLADERIVIVPLDKFPGIKKLSTAQRKQCHIIIQGIGIFFDDDDHVYHISDFLGAENKVGL